MIKLLSFIAFVAVPHYACTMEQSFIASPSTLIKEIADIEAMGNVEEVKLKLKVAEGLGATSPYLQTAILAGKFKALDILLQANAPNKKDATGQTPLACVLVNNKKEALDILFKYPRMLPTQKSEYDDLFRLAGSQEAVNLYCSKLKETFPRESNPQPWITLNAAAYIYLVPTVFKEFINGDYLYIPKAYTPDDSYLFWLIMDFRNKKINLSDNVQYKILNYLHSFQSSKTYQRMICIKDPKCFFSHNVEIDYSPLCLTAQTELAAYFINKYHQTSPQAKHYQNIQDHMMSSCIKPALKNYFNSENDLTWILYAAALKQNKQDVLDALQSTTSINPHGDWNTALKKLRVIKNEMNPKKEDLFSCLKKIYILLHLRPNHFINEADANIIHDLTTQYKFAPDLSTLVYDYTSSDRNPNRKYDLYYWIRRCTTAYHDDRSDSPSTSIITEDKKNQ